MFWVFYMMFSIFRSHRNRFYWRDGKLHFRKQNPQQQGQNQRRLTPAEERQSFQNNIRQWLIFYGVLASIIIAILIYRLNNRQKKVT
ncbi:unnamed protein product [Adineta steineri]|uniref:Uncharacterized protein n=1 Tax=Adineta steineri TaxID=433720 RepID=A0A815MA55_9BILA|nr:unnamed protein product [Adineta steineri]CAF1483419.1 unnamed protein product [Adineta steineri]CAF3622015.1 unnamed protein product [Adineta steineri]CAF3895034.1 unnamed protein product [Adineta steineri]